MRRLSLLLLGALVLLHAPAARAEGLELTSPVPGAVLAPFDPGPHPWSRGHRGVDLAADIGQQVTAAADGVVYFSGSVAGRPSVSIDHGNGLRTTYTPVRGTLTKGQTVRAGQMIGHVTAGHCAQGCLHWGLTDGSQYFNPLHYLARGHIRLLPTDATPATVMALPPAVPGDVAQLPPGALPVNGRHTSRFGMRVHPVTGVYKLHDGTDIAAPCGTPIRAILPGRVTRAGYHGAYGYRVVVDHPGGLRTAYAHLPGLQVSVGQQLERGQQLGVVGNTGYSTGCHLHWMLWRDGTLHDPLSLR